MNAEVRAGVVDQLIAIMSDDSLLPDERIEKVFADDIDATAAERYAAAKKLAEISNAGLVEVGLIEPVAEVIKYHPVIVGASNVSLHQLQCIAAIWEIIRRWDVALKPDKTLGDVMKILPPAERDLVLRLLDVEELT